MLDQSLLQSHFIGRDGFRWWIGQIPPISSMGKQIEGGGWGNRFKVRIIGYHPYSEADLPNEDLPWAQCLIPTTAGSGAANVATGVQLQQGDIVLGFFLDGDNAQIPVILATFGRTDQVPSSSYKYPFEGFTGYSSPVNKNTLLNPYDGSASESNELKENSNRSPQSLTEEQARQNSNVSENSAIGNRVPLANTVKNTQVDKVTSVVKNLLRKVRRFQGDIDKIRQLIRSAADKIVTITNDLIGGMFDFLVKQLIKLLRRGLDLLYKLVYAKVLAVTANPVAAHAAGVAAQKAMVMPVKLLEESFSCIAGEVVEKLKDLVVDILESTIDNVDRFISCAADQFVGTLLNTLIGVLETLFDGPLGAVSTLLQFFSDFNVGNLLREGIGLLSEFGVGFGCNQNLNNFKGLVNEWTVGSGPSGSRSTLTNSMSNTYESIKDITNIINSGVDIDSVQQCFTDALKFASPPTINIFGGGPGSGATAIPIYGNLVTNSDGNVTASVIGVQLTNSGSDYSFAPFVEIVDDNEQGYGAVARSIINEKGEVTSIYIVSEGENYSVGNIEEYSVLNVVVEDGGNNYEDAEVIDNFGNSYNSQIVDGRIYQVTPLNNITDSLPILTVTSNTGSGAILRPLLGASKFTGELQTSIDCPI
ncbi:hypothetical protein EBU71_09035 [bacterium]|jgi:hypothetical protein|nr:hypothetical protein [Candidatus Elulimicrobium humile]